VVAFEKWLDQGIFVVHGIVEERRSAAKKLGMFGEEYVRVAKYHPVCTMHGMLVTRLRIRIGQRTKDSHRGGQLERERGLV
jgi:hypothetical protein